MLQNQNLVESVILNHPSKVLSPFDECYKQIGYWMWSKYYFHYITLISHTFSIHFFYIGGAFCKFVAVLPCMCDITPGGSDAREVGMNTTQNKLCTHMWELEVSSMYMGSSTEIATIKWYTLFSSTE